LRIGQEYASHHAEKAQKRYADYCNAKRSDKKFDVGKQVIYLVRNTNQKMFSHWLGPCRIIRKKSPHSYVIEVDGIQRGVHVNHLRKFRSSITETPINNCAIDGGFWEWTCLSFGLKTSGNSFFDAYSTFLIQYENFVFLS
jgi:hypothetical protein